MASNAEIYDCIVQQCVPATLPIAWHRLTPEAACVQPSATSELLDVLLRSFTDRADLLRAGVLVLENESPRLHPRLAQPQALILAARDSGRQELVDLIVEGFSLEAQALPCLDVLNGPDFPASGAGQPQVLFAAPAMRDVAVLRAIGMAAAPATGLDRLDTASLARLLRMLGRQSHDHRGAVPETPQRDLMLPPITLMLVDWCVADMVAGPCPEIETIRAHLWQFHEYLKIDLEACAVWRPSPEEIRRIKFCATYGDHQQIREACDQSHEENSFTLENPTARESQDSYAAKQRAWLATAARGSSSGSTDEWRKVNHAYDTEIIAPLLAEAAASQDVLKKLTLMSLANVSRCWHAQGLAMTGHVMQLAHQVPLAKFQLPPEQFEQQSVLLDQILTLSREISKCTPRR